jgi:hypothetical protein
MIRMDRLNKLNDIIEIVSLNKNHSRQMTILSGLTASVIKNRLYDGEKLDIGLYTYKINKSKLDYYYTKNRYKRRMLISKIIKIHGGDCYVCGEKLDSSDITIDHLTPKSRLPKSICHRLENLCVMHHQCNQNKSDKIPPRLLVACNTIKVNIYFKIPLLTIIMNKLEKILLTNIKRTTLS